MVMIATSPANLSVWQSVFISALHDISKDRYPGVILSVQMNVVDDRLMIGVIENGNTYQTTLMTRSDIENHDFRDISLMFHEVVDRAVFHLRNGHDPIPPNPAQDYDDVMASCDAMDKAIYDAMDKTQS